MRYIVMSCLVIVAVLVPLSRGTAAAPKPAVWYNCYLHVKAPDSTRVVARSCYTVPIHRQHTKQIGWRITRTHIWPRLIHSVRYPTFYVKPKPTPTPARTQAPTQPSGQSVWLWVTGYSWGCGAGYSLTSAGTEPGIGTVASNIFPLGTRVYVPSLGYQGVVLDRGAPLDLFAPSCAETYGYTGLRQVIVY